MKSINKRILSHGTVTIPGSKSISHRMMICAALAHGRSTVKNLLDSEDLSLTRSALIHMGAAMDLAPDGTVTVQGVNGVPSPHGEPIYLGNSGTSMRLLAGIAALGQTPYVLTGDQRMQQRPMGDLLAALEMIDVRAVSEKGNGCPPVRIQGGNRTGGSMTIDCSQSSQYLSSLLMMGAVLEQGVCISLPTPAVSAPYIDLTMDIMAKFNVKARRVDEMLYEVPGGQSYVPGEFVVEPDLSNASYFWAMGAVSGKKISVAHINQSSLQGDIRLLDILEQMGCEVIYDAHGITVSGKDLCAVEVDMADIPDVVPTLAVVACFAKGTTKINNISHLRQKECDRISVVVSQLKKMGVDAREGDDWLSVTGTPSMKGGLIETFNDHRIAMAFSVIGLMVEGVLIENEGCVAKSFPGFWEIFDQL
ncbi:3-phosphoshikimate 1-carboxyvinyltransferase [Desulfocicer vacuolatum DSM 3385]|uniref:3-phosphoshikimate 1-carboxyvinyltransferase n=1 Tax=Desulfocicer vacuolatum DSM 3385 TaxID=1121400 RepID=A0A1W1ZLB8_9BACT|nr:3-phosphoshikimate 1-carboxyvinyltransferase [Desulfocicer vacuolatum]SMC49157.1 3-phosphoshikimate 1-carboxyvinyltransferase [Desulfocicer vacuolatum DSM 3385]